MAAGGSVAAGANHPHACHSHQTPSPTVIGAPPRNAPAARAGQHHLADHTPQRRPGDWRWWPPAFRAAGHASSGSGLASRPAGAVRSALDRGHARHHLGGAWLARAIARSSPRQPPAWRGGGASPATHPRTVNPITPVTMPEPACACRCETPCRARDRGQSPARSPGGPVPQPAHRRRRGRRPTRR